MIKLNDENFEEEVLDKPYAVVDFYAEWCGPCKMLSPIMEQLNEKHSQVFKCDTDKAQLTAEQYGITNLPTVLIFKEGEIVDTITGVKPLEFYDNLLNKHELI